MFPARTSGKDLKDPSFAFLPLPRQAEWRPDLNFQSAFAQKPRKATEFLAPSMEKGGPRAAGSDRCRVGGWGPVTVMCATAPCPLPQLIFSLAATFCHLLLVLKSGLRAKLCWGGSLPEGEGAGKQGCWPEEESAGRPVPGGEPTGASRRLLGAPDLAWCGLVWRPQSPGPGSPRPRRHKLSSGCDAGSPRDPSLEAPPEPSCRARAPGSLPHGCLLPF